MKKAILVIILSLFANSGFAMTIENLTIENAVVSFGEAAPAYWAKSFIVLPGELETIAILAAPFKQDTHAEQPALSMTLHPSPPLHLCSSSQRVSL